MLNFSPCLCIHACDQRHGCIKVYYGTCILRYQHILVIEVDIVLFVFLSADISFQVYKLFTVDSEEVFRLLQESSCWWFFPKQPAQVFRWKERAEIRQSTSWSFQGTYYWTKLLSGTQCLNSLTICFFFLYSFPKLHCCSVGKSCALLIFYTQ
jgi:hypothetical protein